MPIAAATSTLNSSINAALNMGKAANQSAVIAQIIAALGSSIPMGLYPTSPSPPFPIPLVPSGIAAAQAQALSGFSMGKAADVDTVAKILANAVSLAAPIVPPSGLSALESQIKNALSMEKSANQATVASLLATAIIQYYTSAGVL